MRFDWDEKKRITNIVDHAFDFADAWEIFEADMLADIDDREDYGEDRWTGIRSFSRQNNGSRLHRTGGGSGPHNLSQKSYEEREGKL